MNSAERGAKRMRIADAQRRRLAIGAILCAGCCATRNFAFAATPQVHAARFAPATRTTEHCLPWIAAEAGIFAKMGVEPSFAEGESNPEEALDGLARGQWDFAYAGIAQVAQKVLDGNDLALIVTPVQSNKGGFVMTRRDIRTPEQLAGARVGVLSESGASALAARAVLDRWQVPGTLVPLKTFEAVYTALAEERVDAGWLPIDMSFRGRRAFGWNAFQGVRLGIPGGVATSRRTIASKAPMVAAVVKGLVTAIYFFKTDRDNAVSLLQRWLNVPDRGVAEDLRDFYDSLLRSVPTPTAFFGLQGLRESLAARYPAAGKLQPPDFMDPSFVDALERAGYIARLYSSLRYQ